MIVVLKLLLRRGAKKDARNNSQVTPTLTAAFFGHAPVVEVLLKWCAAAAVSKSRFLCLCTWTTRLVRCILQAECCTHGNCLLCRMTTFSHRQLRDDADQAQYAGHGRLHRCV